MSVMTGGMLFSIVALTKDYLSYPVKVDVSLRREKQVVFPAVTVCNMSPVKKSALDTADLSATSKRRKKRSVSGLYISLLYLHHLLLCSLSVCVGVCAQVYLRNQR